jgi:hypothetical protein
VLIDSVFIMLCLPDTDVHNMMSFVFEPALTQFKQMISHKINITPENLLKNVQKSQL